MSDMARWAKVEVVNGVMGMIYHTYDTDQDQYVIHCMIQTDVGEFAINAGRKEPWTQQQFDAINFAGMVTSCVETAREMGFEPVSGAVP